MTASRTTSPSTTPPRSEVRFRRVVSFSVVLGSMLLTALIAYYVLDIPPEGGQLATVVAGVGLLAFLGVQFVRYRQRISLRTLLLGITVLAVGLAWFGRQWAISRDETAAVEHLLQRGASASFTSAPPREDELFFQAEGGWYLPAWLHRTLGASYFAGLQQLGFGGTEVTDADLQVLAQVRRVREVDFSAPGISAEGLAALPLVPGLKDIYLDWRQVSTDSVERLAQLPDLKFVQTFAPQHQIASSPTFWSRPITFGNPPVSVSPPDDVPDDVVTLARLTQVEKLTLWVGNYSSKAMAALAGMPNLQELTLDGDFGPLSWEEECFVSLAKSRTIRALTITYASAFGDADLAALQQLASLQSLRLDSTQITVDGYRAFRKARPNVRLIVYPPPRGMTRVEQIEMEDAERVGQN